MGLDEEKLKDNISDRNLWNEYLKSYSYGQRLQPIWKDYIKSDASNETDHLIYQKALNNYVLSQNDQTSASVRMSHLQNSYNLLASINKDKLSLPRLFTLIRVCKETGHRKRAVNLLHNLLLKFLTVK